MYWALLVSVLEASLSSPTSFATSYYFNYSYFLIGRRVTICDLRKENRPKVKEILFSNEYRHQLYWISPTEFDTDNRDFPLPDRMSELDNQNACFIQNDRKQTKVNAQKRENASMTWWVVSNFALREPILVREGIIILWLLNIPDS